ncbi:MAG: GIY-YIG nuclease family protein [Bacteroidia bacterium]|jgi:hypothetical protein|nr:GIY-YIG nuclease family protein [Bacteroidia bacterium]
MEQGLIYILTNPAMPGLVKIGKTNRVDVKQRMFELYSTGVPVPFDCAYAAKVNNPDKVEMALHTAFSPNRINAKREFFSIEPLQAIAILKLLEIADQTQQVDAEPELVDATSLEAGEAMRKKRPNFNFTEMQIAAGSELVCVRNGESAIVQTARTVLFRGEETSLTNATKAILELDYSVAPGPYWTFNGRLLRDIYNETYLQ